eukprot:TRINITY_DN15522_c0_g1_i1.p1 TRINITY_DN15522_c0_g1~~TRINITY_DN15522_c0_g1_i1.p1  ORF type:complete len:172 (-),score=34.10 TRINITY_DN15522_c0_g1_i1:686-1201(-)
MTRVFCQGKCFFCCFPSCFVTHFHVRANLSGTYFTDRQDRYVVIQDSAFSDFIQEAVDTVGKFSSVHPRQFDHEAFRNALHQLNPPSISDQTSSLGNDDVLLFLGFQLGVSGVRQEELMTKELFKLGDQDSSLWIASGYMNFTDEYIHLLNQRPGSLSLIAAGLSPNVFVR